MNPDDGKRYVINLYLQSKLLNLLLSPRLAIADSEVFCLLDSCSTALFPIVKERITVSSLGIFVKLTFVGLDVFYCRS